MPTCSSSARWMACGPIFPRFRRGSGTTPSSRWRAITSARIPPRTPTWAASGANSPRSVPRRCASLPRWNGRAARSSWRRMRSPSRRSSSRGRWPSTSCPLTGTLLVPGGALERVGGLLVAGRAELFGLLLLRRGLRLQLLAALLAPLAALLAALALPFHALAAPLHAIGAVCPRGRRDHQAGREDAAENSLHVFLREKGPEK